MSFIFEPGERQSTIRTVRALLLHERRSDGFGAQTHWLTTHEVEDDGHGPLIGPGRLLSEGDKRAIIDTLLGTLAPEEFSLLPANVLAIGAGRIAWFVPGCRRNMYFNLKGHAVSLRVPWPTLVFRVVDRQLALTALASEERPTAKSPLFHAPLMNISEGTLLCTGNAVVPFGASTEDRAGYERAVFETNFTHVNHDRTLTVAKEVDDATHVRFWHELQNSKADGFPVEALVPLRCTLGQWLQHRSQSRPPDLP